MKLEKTYPAAPVLIIVALSFLISSYFVIPSFQPETLQTNWKVSMLGTEKPLHTGKAVDFHFFLEDERGQPLEGAEVTAIFDRIETVHQIDKNFRELNNGLYETEIIFSVPGTWIVMLDIKKGKHFYRNQYLFDVEGPIIAKENRDPADHFNLQQPLPMDLKRVLNNGSVFKR